MLAIKLFLGSKFENKSTILLDSVGKNAVFGRVYLIQTVINDIYNACQTRNDDGIKVLQSGDQLTTKLFSIGIT